MSALERLKNGIYLLSEDLDSQPSRYQTIINQEAEYKAAEQISAVDLKSIMTFIKSQLKDGVWDEELTHNKSMRIPKGENGNHPKRSLSIITLPNGEFSIIVETKSKLHDNKKIVDLDPTYKKPHGAVKHGTPCMLLWPRKVDVPNKKWWSSVVDKEAAFEEVLVEANVSMQNNPYIQNAIVGPIYHSASHQDKRLSLYGEIAESGDFDEFLKQQKPKLEDMERIVYSFLLGIEHLHQSNILHRDIKPVNILVDKDEQGHYYGKVMDFGESKKDRTKISGDPKFFSPEAAAVFFNKKPDKYNILCKDAVCDFLYNERITTQPPVNFHASGADDIWSIGAMMLNLYSDYGIIDKATVKKMLNDIPSQDYDLLKMKIAENNAIDADKILYIVVNCLWYNLSDRFTISQIIDNLPNTQLIDEFRSRLDSHDKKTNESIEIPEEMLASKKRVGSVVFSKPSSSYPIINQSDNEHTVEDTKVNDSSNPPTEGANPLKPK